MASLQDFKADLFRALGHAGRIRILEALQQHGALTVGEIQQLLGIEAPNVSQLLATMRSRGLVDVRREGTHMWYSVADPAVFELLSIARSIFERRTAAQAVLLDATP